jgi:hypothetical protein
MDGDKGATRKPLGLRRRFAVFKRDHFTCGYCGRTPPAVVLEVDHIKPVSDGGTDEDHNLITSCFDCNRGRADGTLDATPIDVEEKSRLLKERYLQVEAYEKLLSAERAHLDNYVDEISQIYEDEFEGWTLIARSRISIRNFLKQLPPSEVMEAMEIAVGRKNENRAFRCFCGICWNKIRQMGQ